MALPRRQRPWTRWEEDNRLTPNPGAFLAVAAIVGAIAGLAILIALVD